MNISALLLAISAMQAAQSAGQEVTPPQPVGDAQSWITTDDYPSDAQDFGAFGTTTTRMQVGADGRVTNCEISVSSGHLSLDAASCALLTERARYSPARDRRGRAIAGTVTRSVRWTLPEMDPLLPPVAGYTNVRGVIVRMRVGEDGRVAECHAYPANASSNPQPLENEAEICAGVRAQSDANPAVNVPPGGFWLEQRQIGYVYRFDPRWGQEPASTGTPPIERPDPLPPDET